MNSFFRTYEHTNGTKVRKLRMLLVSAFILLVGLFAVVPAFAAEFYFISKGTTVGIDQEFEVTVNLDTFGENVNAISGAIIFNPELLSFKNARLNFSQINFWVTEPKESSPGRVEFAGITPGGWVGESEIFGLALSAKKVGSSNIDIIDGSVLKNDGTGTSLSVTAKSLAISVQSSAVAGVGVEKVVDNVSPDAFVIEVGQSPTVFDGKWFAAFNAQDKQSGISYYEVQESAKRVPDANKWTKATSPYVLSDQTRSDYIFVKAVDYSGNERLSYGLPTARPLANLVYVLGIVILFAFCGIIYVLWRRQKVKK